MVGADEKGVACEMKQRHHSGQLRDRGRDIRAAVLRRGAKGAQGYNAGGSLVFPVLASSTVGRQRRSETRGGGKRSRRVGNKTRVQKKGGEGGDTRD